MLPTTFTITLLLWPVLSYRILMVGSKLYYSWFVQLASYDKNCDRSYDKNDSFILVMLLLRTQQIWQYFSPGTELELWVRGEVLLLAMCNDFILWFCYLVAENFFLIFFFVGKNKTIFV